jgi:lipid-binding SYLF domain-containing protein
MTTCCATFTDAVGRLAKAATVAGLLLVGTPALAAANDEAERLAEGFVVLQEIMDAPDASIPEAILDRAIAIAVFPSTVRAGFIFGGQRGRGFIAARDPDTSAWSPPAFLTLTGGSIGLQVGAQQADVVLLIQNRRGLARLLGNQFKLGADASAAVGPVGRSLEASTDLQMTAEILSYSRSRGVFAGVTLGGATLRADRDANERFYGVRLDSRQIVLEGRTGAALPEAAARLQQALDRVAP